MADAVQVNQAINLTDRLIACLNDAEQQLSSAGRWGIFDVLGGGLLVDLIKHSKINNAKDSMEQVNYLMQELQRVLGSISVPQDYRMNINGFATFADFFFDNGFTDIYMTAKIMSSLKEVRRLKDKCYELKIRLQGLR